MAAGEGRSRRVGLHESVSRPRGSHASLESRTSLIFTARAIRLSLQPQAACWGCGMHACDARLVISSACALWGAGAVDGLVPHFTDDVVFVVHARPSAPSLLGEGL